MQCVAATPTVEFRLVVVKQSLEVPRGQRLIDPPTFLPTGLIPQATQDPLDDMVSRGFIAALSFGRPFVRLAAA